MQTGLLGRIGGEGAAATGVLLALAAGGALWLADRDGAAGVVWAAAIVALLVPLIVSIARALARGTLGVDLVALVAMGGALALGEYLARP